jgi:DNA polymerase III delta prime subunit
MLISDTFNPLNSTKLISLDFYLDEMIKIYNLKKFPKVLILNGKKGMGKFTLVLHFLNYIYTQNEKKKYDLKDKIINTESNFYNQLLNKTNQDVLFIQAEENKNIKIEEIRNLKSILSRSSLSNNPRFIVIDEVEFFNENSVNALLKSLEEPGENNFFILINNQQANLIKTISSRCLKSNIFLNSNQTVKVINFLIETNNIENVIDFNQNITPGLYLRFNEIFLKYSIDKNDNIQKQINKLLDAYKKNKNKIIINLTLFLIDKYFFELIKKNQQNLDSLLNTKSSIIKIINEFTIYNLNINSVLNSIKIKLNNV